MWLLAEPTGMVDHDPSLAGRLRWLVVGRGDGRLRATWRFVLAWPLLPAVGAVVAAVMPALGLSGLIPGGPLQGLVFLGLLVPWARYVDRRPLADYGVAASRRWVVDLAVGFLAVVGVWGGWHAFAAAAGWMHLETAVAGSPGSLLYGLGGRWVSLAVNTWVQDVAFFAIVLASAAEGLHSRDVSPAGAVLGGWAVAVLFFTAIHDTPTALDAVATAVGGAVFGLLYVHTGELALTIGVHWGASYAAGTLFASPALARDATVVFEVSRALPGEVGGAARLLLYAVTYLVLLGWLHLARGGVTVETGLAQWVGRG